MCSSDLGRVEGNAFVGPSMKTIKWTDAQIAKLDKGEWPVDAEAAETAVFGDVDKGFKEADLVVERVMHQQTTSHQPLESRSCMAYWQNGKCYMHVSTQSLARTVASVAGWVGVKPEELVLISEYTGGGFGSKIPGAQSMAIPALMSKKLNGRPVMMRISRAEETYIGRVRPGYQGWIKMGFKKDGRVTAIDTFIVEASGPYRRQGDHATTASLGSLLFQAPNMRFRGVSIATNTPPGVSQRAPGGLQASVWFEPLVHEAAKKLGIDQVAIRKLNAPEGEAVFGLAAPNTPPGRPRSKVTSCFVKECLDQGAEMFGWEAKKATAGKRVGSKVRGIGVGTGAYTAGSIGVDGLCILRPDGKLEIHQGIGNLGTHSVIDTARVIAEVVNMPWENCEVVWGNTSKGLPWSSIQAGSQTTYAHTRANYATGQDLKKKLQEVAAKTKGGSPEGYDTGAQGVIRKGGGLVMTWAQAADAADQGWQDLQADLSMVLRNAAGEESRRELRIRLREIKDDGDQSLITFQLPRDIGSAGRLAQSSSALTNFMSKPALWITSGESPRNSRNSSTTWANSALSARNSADRPCTRWDSIGMSRSGFR